MSTIGQIVGGIVGAVAGYFLSGFNPYGAVIGFQLGMGIGSFIDPPKQKEDPNQLTNQDLQFNTFSRNLPVPVIYGRNKVAGNVLWIGNTRTEIREREAEGEGGSLGMGGSTPMIKEIFYHADFHIGLSEGPITNVNSVAVDDMDISDREGLDFDVMLGRPDQEIDSLMTTAIGADAVPFRNLAHLRFHGELGAFNRIPIISSVVDGIDAIGGQVNSGAVWTVVFSDGAVTENANVGVRDEAGRLYFGDGFGKVWRSTDAGSSWTAVVSRIAPNGGINDMVARRGNNALYAVGPNSLIAANQVTKPVWRSTDQGATWTQLVDFGAGFPPITQFVEAPSRITVAGSRDIWVVIPNKPGIIIEDTRNYIGISHDDGATWTVNSGPDMQLGADGAAAVVGIAAPQGMPGRLVAGTNRGAIYVTDNDGGAWVRVHADVGSGTLVNDWRRGFAIGGRRVVAFLNTAAGVQSGTTTRLVAVSRTGGNSFSLFNGPTANLAGGATSLSWINEQWWFVSNVLSAAVWQSRNGGRTWSTVDGPPTGPGDSAAVLAHTSPRLFDGWMSGGTRQRISEIPIGLHLCNPAWVIYDLLINKRYGLGLDEVRIDIASFDEVAEYCDTLVLNPDGTTEVRFCVDIVLETQQPVLDHLRDILATFRGFLVWSQGTVKLRVAKDEAVTQAFTMDTIAADSFIWKKQGYRERPNVMRIEYINIADDFRHDFVEAFDDWDVDTTGERRERILRLLGIKRTTQANRMVQFYLDQAMHINHAIAFRVGIAALESEVGDIVTVSHDVPAWTAKPFRIMEISEAENDEMQLTLMEHNAAIYHDHAVGPSQGGGGVPQDPSAQPYQVIRLSPYKRPLESLIEVAYTRASSADFFAGALLYRQRGTAAFEPLPDTILALAPTAFLDSQVFSFALSTVGSDTAFTDTFDRTDNDSLGANWTEQVQTIWQVHSNNLMRGSPTSGAGPAGGAVARASLRTYSGNVFTQAKMLDTDGVGIGLFVGVGARWTALSGAGVGSVGTMYYFDYTTRTISHSIIEVGLYKVTNAGSWQVMSFAYVNSGTYFTRPGSPTTFRIEQTSYTVRGLLNNVEVVSAVDSSLQGPGEGVMARRERTVGYADVVRTDSPVAYWRFGETTQPHGDWWRGTHPASRSAGATAGAAGALRDDHDRAISFDATNIAAIVADHAILNFTSGITIEAWVTVATSTAANQRNILQKAPGGGYRLGMADGTSQITFTHFSTGSLWNTGVFLAINTWQHVVATWDGSYQTVYIQGTCVASRANTVPMSTNNQQLVFGNGQVNWAGTLDEVALYSYAISSARVAQHYWVGVGCGTLVTAQGERWDDFVTGGGRGLLTLRHIPDGWSVRLFSPNCGTADSQVESGNIVTLTFESSVASGFLQLYTDGTSYTAGAPGDGRYPATGVTSFQDGDVYDWHRLQGFLTAVQTSIPIYWPKGGFANVGSARIRAEEVGYATFADSLLTGVGRGGGGSTATSHTNVISVTLLVGSGSTATGSGQFIDASIPATQPQSNVTLFPQNSRFVIITAGSKFSRVTWDLAVNATQVVSLFYEYSTGPGSWASATRSGFLLPVDTTSGFTQSGETLVEPWGDWAPTATIASGTVMGDGTSRYALRLGRASATLSTAPVEMRVLVEGETLVTVRNTGAFIYTPVLVDSGQTLTFKAVAVTPADFAAAAADAPVRALMSGPYLP